MPLTLTCTRVADPDGHNPALLLKGDWLIVSITDGTHTGYGEASHSRDDVRCEEKVRALFDAHVAALGPDIDTVQALESGAFARAEDLVTATAMSALNQALYDLIARREGLPVWRLFVETPAQPALRAYATINRALTTRTHGDYLRTVTCAVEQGFDAIKCAPFEAVTPDGDQAAQSEIGLGTLRLLRERFPGLSIRVDMHKRFAPEAFRAVAPAIDAIAPRWIEEPVAIGPAYSERRGWSPTQMALGELFFGAEGFRPIVEGGWADVIMPDPKHVGGFGPLAKVVRTFAHRVEISPHNPSGPVASMAALSVAALSTMVTSIELPLITDPARAYYLPWLHNGALTLPEGPGWGCDQPLNG